MTKPYLWVARNSYGELQVFVRKPRWEFDQWKETVKGAWDGLYVPKNWFPEIVKKECVRVALSIILGGK